MNHTQNDSQMDGGLNAEIKYQTDLILLEIITKSVQQIKADQNNVNFWHESAKVGLRESLIITKEII